MKTERDISMLLREFDSQPRGEDELKGGLHSDVGIQYAKAIKYYLQREGIATPETASYLGFGVGHAYPELAFIKQMNLSHHQTTFVDKAFDSQRKSYLIETYPHIHLQEEGLFNFVASTSQKYQFVSTFGLEYLLQGEHLDAFIRLLPPLLHENAIVFSNFDWSSHTSVLGNLGFDDGPSSLFINKSVFRYKAPNGKKQN